MKALAILCTIVAAAPLCALADCVEPTPPGDPPSGATATRQEMVAAQTAIKGYDAAVGAFAECIKKDGGPASKADDAVRSVERIAARFNAELRTFKQRNGG
jgi:uncharacterized protein (DUF849 family)